MSSAVALPSRPARPQRGVARRTAEAYRSRWIRILVFVVALVGALAANGKLPGLSWPLVSTLATEGDIGCLAHHNVLAVRCADTGLPTGSYVSDGVGFYWFVAGISALPIIGTHGAVIVAATLSFATSMLGVRSLLRRLNVRFVISIAAGCLYLLSPTLIGMGGFGGTFWGFVLLPAFISLDLYIADRWRSATRLNRVLLTLSWVALKSALLLTDGYVFVICAVISGCALAATARWKQWTATVSAVAAFVLAHLAAYGVYELLLPNQSSFQRDSLDLFRGLGLDLTSVVTPSPFIWWASRLNLGNSLFTLWGDTSNALWNYAGYGCLALAVAGVAFGRKNRLVWALVAAGLITFVMSLGPSLKIGDHRPAPTPGQPANLYLMPASAAQHSLPTAALHESLPGVDLMRATYRWFGGTRLVLIVLAAAGAQRLLERSAEREHAAIYRSAVGAVAVLAFVEILPPPGTMLLMYRQTEHERRSITAVADDLGRAIPKNSRVVFTAIPTKGFPNDYLVPYLLSHGDYRTYNVAGDKNVVRVASQWPAPVRRIVLGEGSLAAAKQAFGQHLVDVVVIPHFDIQLTSGSWPSGPEYGVQGTSLAKQWAADPALRVTDYQWFSIVTPAKP
jgi:hypothetical protein